MLFVPSHDETWFKPGPSHEGDGGRPRAKKPKTEHRRRPKASEFSPNPTAVQAHVFHLPRHFVSCHTDACSLDRHDGGNSTWLDHIDHVDQTRRAKSRSIRR